MTTLPVAVIPAYCPSGVLCNIVRDLLDRRIFSRMVVVDDGSAPESASVFERLRAMDGVVVLRHAVNLGKGAALKTAFNYVLLNFPDAPGVITLDADGQHLARDVEVIYTQLQRSPNRVHLGVRQFDGSVPLLSRLGNVVTRRVFRLFIGKDVADTQTGLRGIPLPLLPGLLNVQPNGYDFELEMLVRFVRANVPIEQHAISTEYEPGNPSSHFNPLFDSFRIYFVFLRFSIVSIMSFVLDTTVFGILNLLTGKILSSLLLARLASGIFQFLCSKVVVFKSVGSIQREAAGFLLLLVTLMLVSWALILGAVNFLGLPPLLAKILVETALFLTSYTVQQNVVFVHRNSRETP